MSPEANFVKSNSKRRDVLMRSVAALSVGLSVVASETEKVHASESVFNSQEHVLFLDGVPSFTSEIYLTAPQAAGPILPDTNIELIRRGPDVDSSIQKEAIRLQFEEQKRIEEEQRLAEEARQKQVSATSSSSNWPSFLQPCGGDLPPCSVAQRESNGNYNAVNSTGCVQKDRNGVVHQGCYGKWQFSIPTWDNYMGYAKATDAPPDIQDAKARETWAGGAGCSHWAAC